MRFLTGSIRTKLTLSLLAMSFIAIVVVGLTSRELVLGRFERLVFDRATQGFISEVREYYETYGSWEAAREAELFFSFVKRTRPRHLKTPARPSPKSLPSLPSRRETVATPPPPGRFELSDGPPPLVVTDQEGKVLLPLAGRQIGEVIEAESLALGAPIFSKGKLIGMAIPQRRPGRTQLEDRYLSAAEDSWIYALGLAFAIAIPIGFWLGSRLAGPIAELTHAMRAMRKGQLLQSVPVRTDDEMGRLTEDFNKMSRALSTAYAELEGSRAKLEEQARMLEILVRQDALTRLMNRRAFDETAGYLFAKSKRYSHSFTLAMADIDHFKMINDRFSHATGDEVLRSVAFLIRSNIREADVVARYGGEEFAIAFPETSAREAAELSNRLRELVASHAWTDLHPGLSVTLSLGLSERNGASSFEEMLGAADQKLYEAKNNGRNRVCF